VSDPGKHPLEGTGLVRSATVLNRAGVTVAVFYTVHAVEWAEAFVKATIPEPELGLYCVDVKRW